MTFTKIAFVGAALALIATGAPALAKPNNPNAANTSSGTGCLVRDGAGAYHYDAACEWKLVVKHNKDGSLKFFSYQDKGNVPEGAPLPDSASINEGPWPGCGADIREVTTPSGQYSSTCRFGN